MSVIVCDVQLLCVCLSSLQAFFPCSLHIRSLDNLCDVIVPVALILIACARAVSLSLSPFSLSRAAISGEFP